MSCCENKTESERDVTVWTTFIVFTPDMLTVSDQKQTLYNR